MGALDVLEQVCTYLAGPYDATLRAYHQSPRVITGLAMAKRGRPKRQDAAMFHLDATAPEATAALVVAHLPEGMEHRIAFAGPIDGRKEVVHQVELHGYVRSTEEYAEDVNDFTYTLVGAIRDRIHADRTCGSGGFENGAFQVGEGDLAEFRWQVSQTVTAKELTSQTFWFAFDAKEIIAA